MQPDQDIPLPRQVKIVDTSTLLRLEERAHELGVNQKLDPAWVAATAAPEADHFLWPACWNSPAHLPELPRQIRCELLLALHTGEHVLSLLDILPDDFTPLPRLTSRDIGERVSRQLDTSPSVREWLLRQPTG
ncbi:hypothetical protein [Kitasatospora camelliae]|uniref:Uncharacterized protein n=1 Tax=Kitasatospora camelliae TaxID=3156397 RepID=A0AAU8JQ58_9ACTN